MSYVFEDNAIPKYKQLMNLIISDIQSGIYSRGDQVPSINKISEEYLLSRDTVEKAYRKLGKKGILKSVKGKGYYVVGKHSPNFLRICLIFNKLSNYKKATYDGFVQEIENEAIIDLHVYNYNIKVFERIIENNLENYDYFVIIPHFHPGSLGLEEIVRKIPSEKVFIIDKKINRLFNEYPCVYQDFEEDIIQALKEGKELLQKYHRLNLVFPESRFFSREIRDGFLRFCREYSFQQRVIDDISNESLTKGEAYILISDEDLVVCLRKMKESGFTPGRQCGVLSYNDNPVKEILEDGITTISTNHELMGKMAARMIRDKEKGKLRIPFELKIRNSL